MPIKFIHDFNVVRNESLNEDHFVLDLEAPETLPPLFPGQFVEVKIEDSPTTFLRRPLSIHDVDTRQNTLSLLVQKKGDGTRRLSLLKPGNSVNLIYPLGNHFTLLQKKKVLLVGGGCGIAPLRFLARKLNENGCEVTTLMGARTATGIMEKPLFETFGRVEVTTEDGSMGTKGFVIHHSLWRREPFLWEGVYTCGPDPMMKAIARLASLHHVPCEVSLEQTMACGLGACLVCVVKTHRGNVCTCTEGPVFLSNELAEWL